MKYCIACSIHPRRLLNMFYILRLIVLFTLRIGNPSFMGDRTDAVARRRSGVSVQISPGSLI